MRIPRSRPAWPQGDSVSRNPDNKTERNDTCYKVHPAEGQILYESARFRFTETDRGREVTTVWG
jgi:hypothetical protein